MSAVVSKLVFSPEATILCCPVPQFWVYRPFWISMEKVIINPAPLCLTDPDDWFCNRIILQYFGKAQPLLQCSLCQGFPFVMYFTQNVLRHRPSIEVSIQELFEIFYLFFIVEIFLRMFYIPTSRFICVCNE